MASRILLYTHSRGFKSCQIGGLTQSTQEGMWTFVNRGCSRTPSVVVQPNISLTTCHIMYRIQIPDATPVQHGLQHIIHQFQKSSWSVGQSKQHYCKILLTISCFKGSLGDDILLLKTGSQINVGEVLSKADRFFTVILFRPLKSTQSLYVPSASLRARMELQSAALKAR